MKTRLIILMVIMITGNGLHAQNDSLVLNKFYHAWIIPVKGQKGKSGVLYEVKDSVVVVSNSPWKGDYYNGNYTTTSFDVRNIREIKVRRQGRGFAILAGGISGMIVGGFISAAYMNHLEETMNPVGFVFGGFLQGIFPFIISTGVGIGIGAILSAKKTIPINGTQNIYEYQKSRLNQYALVRNTVFEDMQIKTVTKPRDSVADIDGNLYFTLEVDKQTWMAEDLKVTRFRDGTEISGFLQGDSKSEIWYDWNAVNSEHKLCPAGWHIPTFGEWTVLFNSLGGKEGAVDRMAENFSVQDPTKQWWTATALDTDYAQSLYLNKGKSGIMFTGVSKSKALSVRCLKDK